MTSGPVTPIGSPYRPVPEPPVQSGKRTRAFGNPITVAAWAVAASVLVIAALGPAIAPYDPLEPLADLRLATPSWDHPMGGDHLGRDLLSRTLAGAQVSIGMAIAVVLVSAAVGIVIGLVAGACGGWLDDAVMRLTDIFFAFPEMVAALAVAGVLGGGGGHLLLALGVVGWMRYARLVRGITLAARDREHVQLARLNGVGWLRIVRHHLLPASTGAVIVMMTAHVSRSVLAISGLGFLGFGVQPPNPEWGTILLEGRSYILSAWHYAILPGVPIMLSALAFNLIGDSLRDRYAAATS